MQFSGGSFKHCAVFGHTLIQMLRYVTFSQDIQPTSIHSLSTGTGNDIVHEPPFLHGLRPADKDHFDTIQDISCIQNNAHLLPLNTCHCGQSSMGILPELTILFFMLINITPHTRCITFMMTAFNKFEVAFPIPTAFHDVVW